VRQPLPLDGQWVDLCRIGDRCAWRAFYEQHLPLVYRVARRMGVRDCDLGDVCQEVFLRVHRGLGRFRGDAQLSTWLYSIVVRESARALRARAFRNALLALVGRQAPRAVAAHGARSDAGRDLERLLARLKPRHREVFVLFEWEELSLEEVAETLGCPVETVRSRLRRARAEFRRLRRQDAAVAPGGTP
jgi:RNA polymerase sigma-70 factor (ECF subfamily)